ncbi:MAG: metallophosphoesterase family protein [Thermodesulfobacteriota bacterium]
MRLTVLSDIHGNLEAFRAVLADARRTAPGAPLVCLGDMVGYGADPEEVVQEARAAGVASVLGNHEMGVVRPGTRDRFNPQAWNAVRWAASRLSPQSMDFLAGLPESLVLHGCRFVHGLPPDEVDTYLFQASQAQVVRAMKHMTEDVCFIGHTHQLRLVTLEGDSIKGERLPEGDTALAAGKRFIVNAGAVGQPRDGDPRAKYCVYDTGNRVLTVRYVPYDNMAAARKILEAGQPRVYAERLADLDRDA